jgi:hypothetical protein
MSSGTGYCNVTVADAGNTKYGSQSIFVQVPASQIATTLSWTTPPPSTAPYGSTLTVAATTNSGDSVSLPYVSGPCSTSGWQINITQGTGTCTVMARDNGNSNYPYASITAQITETKVAPSIAWTGAPPSTAPYNSTFQVGATTNSGDGLHYSISGACTYLTFNTTSITMTSGSGTCTVTVTDDATGPPPNPNYISGTLTAQVSASKLAPTVAWTTPPPASAAYGSTFTVAASTNSGDTLTYSASGACTNSGANVTMTSGTGTCSVTANDAATGNANYGSASASGSTTATKAAATVTVGSLTAAYTGNPIPATATTNPPGLAVTLTYNGSATAPSASGSYTVVGTINDANYAGSGTGTLQISLPTYAVTLQTSPSGLPVSVDGGAAQAAPFTVQLIQGSHTIAVATTQAGSTGTQYVFSSWSPAGAASQTINVSANATYTATFNTQYQLTYAVSPVVGGSIAATASGSSVPGGAWLNSGTTVNLTATPAAGYTFGSWSGPVAAAGSAATTVTMSGPAAVTANFSGTTSITTSYTAALVAGQYQVTLTLKNAGSAAASTVSVNAWTLGTATASGLPLSTTNLAAGASASFVNTFPASVGSSGAKVVMRFSGAYPGGTFSGSVAVTLP